MFTQFYFSPGTFQGKKKKTSVGSNWDPTYQSEIQPSSIIPILSSFPAVLIVKNLYFKILFSLNFLYMFISMTKVFDFVYMVNIWPAHLFFLMLLPLSFSYTYCNRSSFMLVAFLLQVYCTSTCIWLDRVHLVAVLQIRYFLQHKGSYCDLKCFTSH